MTFVTPTYQMGYAAPVVKWAYLVTFEQKGIFPIHDYTKFYEELSAQQPWWHYFSNTWILIRTENFHELGPKLQQLIKREDYLLIMPAVGPVTGNLPQEAWTWMAQNMRSLGAW